MSTFTSPTNQIARKTQRCNGCGRLITRGESYLRQRGYNGAEAWTFKQCTHCQSVTSIWDPRDSEDEISEDGYLGWTENSACCIGELRAMAGWAHGWRTHSGKLWPLPTLTEDVTP